MISMKEYYSYKFQVRTNEGITPRLGGRLYQQLKLDQLVNDIKKNGYFGVCLGVMYVVEFQKRGLPHIHMLIWHFPKKYCPATTFDQSGFPIYKWRKTTNIVTKGKIDLDNQATVEIRGKKRRTEGEEQLYEPEDEIQSFFDGRYICGCEAAYRIFGFNIHYRSLSVLRLSFHLPGNKYCTFRSNEALPKVVARETQKDNQLEAYFILNQNDVIVRQYLFDEIPQYYVWNDSDNIWNLRKRGKQIGRMAYAYHSSGELWYLCLLLKKVHGATSFEFLRTVNGHLYPTFHEACKEYGMLDSDKEWHEVLQQCSACGFPQQIRELFVHMMVNCKVSDLKSLWESHWKQMVDDILFNQRKLTGNPLLQLNEKQLEFFGLVEIHKLLKSIGKSLKEFNQMPQPPYIIPRATQGEIVASCITRSKLWRIAKVYKLLHNMRLNKGSNKNEVECLRDFANWVLDLGDGKIKPPNDTAQEYAEDDIYIPKEFCNLQGVNYVDEMIHSTFPNLLENYKNPEYLSERAILTPTNQTVGKVNSNIVETLPGEMFSYFSVDTAEDFPVYKEVFYNVPVI
ncbi:hypothetical protein POM88_043879 [Heracleum sosnowskyi]|uniref:ATP-dependent DNA helicase n=1 Tax=Heracleum sosnowskyi TaxID=360622 RepID=A0AAD8H1S7_9APIA|nr:hypothetical protein POM88_043879 [Heracleum sosnowskyi]